MKPTIPKSMNAAVIDRFGGPGVLQAARIPVPEPGRGEVLIRVRTAGVGAWDPWLREGGSGVGYFPQVPGTLAVASGKDGAELVERLESAPRPPGSLPSPRAGRF